MDTYMLTIQVNSVQEAAIKDLFYYKGWKYEINDVTQSNTRKDQQGCESYTEKHFQSFPVLHIEQPVHYTSLEPVTGTSVYNSCDTIVTTSSVGVTYNMLDKNVHSLVNFTDPQDKLVVVEAAATSQQPTRCSFISEATSKQHADKTLNSNYLNCMDFQQNSDSHCFPSKIVHSKVIDTGENAVLHSKTEADSKSYDRDSNYYQFTVTNANQVEVDLVGNASTSDVNDAAEDGSVPTVSGILLDGNTDTRTASKHISDTNIVPGNGTCSRMKAGFVKTVDVDKDICLEEYEESLPKDLQILFEFMKGLNDFEIDRKLLQPRLKQVLELLKCLLKENLMKNSTCTLQSTGTDKFLFGAERKLESERNSGRDLKEICNSTDTCCNTSMESNVCGIAKDKVDIHEDSDNSSAEELVSCKSIDRTLVNKLENDLCEMKANRKGSKRNMHCQDNFQKRKEIKGETLDAANRKEDSCTFDSQDTGILKQTSNFSGLKSAFTMTHMKLQTNKVKRDKLLGQKTMKTSSTKSLDFDKGTNRSENTICNEKNEGAKFRWTVNRNQRMHRYHRKCETVPSDINMENYSAMEKGFFCIDCRFIFSSKSKFLLHKRLKKGYCLPECIYCDLEEQKEVFQCLKCPKCFQTKDMLERHEEKHVQLLKCSDCDVECYSQKDLTLHRQTSHSEIHCKLYLCDLCGSKFKERKVLNAHRRFVHSDERPEICPSCNKCFKTKSQLKNHLVTHKTASELNLSCEVCGKMFLRVATLKDHVRRHKKEFTCFCTICNKGFYRKYGLEEHMRVHTGDKPFDCKVCGFKCALSCNLVKHMKVHQKYNIT